ncbi:sporulation and spore germination protein [Geothermobacter ehrlichii]|uniref:Sporulation and spore germination protein n=1 Tax=Geothermobacter ehrlichii TaxID=213224 RepID=A0A5D3WG40_9BACT|nr:GerMN domain-containing protein [Geothermobacter ehrlichii]TYO97138.1 sporulation and spore germination protein [Geothermobacter ehrlichii]
MKIRLVAMLVTAGVLAVVVGLLSRQALSPRQDVVETDEPLPAARLLTRDVLVYFGSPEGDLLQSETRQIPDCEDERECLKETLEVLIAGSQTDLLSVLPAKTRILGVELKDDLVTIDFSREFVDAHPGGSRSELLTVYAVVDTLSVNFPYVRQVRFKIEGHPADTIKGHVDLRMPVVADFRYTRRLLVQSGRPISGEEEEEALPTGGGD